MKKGIEPQDTIDGILMVDKPCTWTSHDVCAFVRKNFKIKKVGHAGTLDPMATGVLVLLLGRATKQSNALSASDKSYEGIMMLGKQTDSHDATGAVVKEMPWDHVNLEMIREKARDFTGEILQVPPMVSALKHKGVRLYKLARKGKEVPRDARPVTVHEFNVRKQEGSSVYFSATVSKGTYVRTLVNDLGEALGTAATLSELTRVRSGQFSIDQCLTIDDMRNMTIREFRTKVVPLALITPSYAHSQDDSYIPS